MSDERSTSALAVLSKAFTLLVNVKYWVEHGQSETAIKAIADAENNGWSSLGWRTHFEKYERRAFNATKVE